MKSKCEKAEKLKSLADIGVSQAVCELISGSSTRELIRAARKGSLESILEEIVDVDHVTACYLEILNALKKAGYIRDDFAKYQVSFNWMALMRAAISGEYDENYFDEASNIQRELPYFSDIRYEKFEGFSEDHLKALHAMLLSATSSDGYGILRCRFGLANGTIMTKDDIAEMICKDVSYVRDVEGRAINDFGKVMNVGLIETLSIHLAEYVNERI